MNEPFLPPLVSCVCPEEVYSLIAGKEAAAMRLGAIEIILIVILALVLVGGGVMVEMTGRWLIKNMKSIKTDGQDDDEQEDAGKKA